MPISAYLQAVTHIRPDRLFDAPLFVRSTSLPFNMQSQTQSNWCWAATATSVSLFYSATSGWTQCAVANDELGLSNCCTSPVPGACNVPWFLDRALTRTQNYVSISGPLSFADVEAELKTGRVVGARTGWAGGGGHFMVIYGVVRIGATEYFQIDDPIFGKSQPTVATFSTSYQGSGTWTHAYRTRRRRLVFDLKLIPIPDFLPQVLGRHLAVPEISLSDLAEKRISLALAHRGYILRLTDLAEGRELPERSSFTRVFQVTETRPVGYVDVRESTEEVAQIGGSDSVYPQAFERALARAEAVERQSEEPVEPRLVRIPALYTDILWLHAGSGQDYATVISSPQDLGGHDVMPLEDLLGRLRELARRQAEYYRDDEDGTKGS